MAGHERWGETIAADKVKKEPNPIHIIFMRRVGRMWSMDISAPLLAFSAIFCLAYLAFSLMAVSQYLELRTENRELQKQLALASEEVGRLKEQTIVLNQYQQLVQKLDLAENGPQANTLSSDRVSSPPIKPEPGESAENQSREPKPDNPSDGNPMSETMGDENGISDLDGAPNENQEQADNPGTAEGQLPAAPTDQTVPQEPAVVDAMALNISPVSNNSVQFRFNLKNIHPQNKPVGGHLFIILEGTRNGNLVQVAYPSVDLEKGYPTDFKKGTMFSINYGKTVRGTVNGLVDGDRFSQAWVFAFSQDGALLMRKKLESDHD